MNMAFFTEMGFNGKIPRNHPNPRTEFAWMIALEADHYNLFQPSKGRAYDLGIIIIPKKHVSQLVDIDVLGRIKNMCRKVAVMQEGPNWYFQDYGMREQIWYYNMLRSVDYIFCHNASDKKYYDGLLDVDSVVMPSLMIEDMIKDVNFDREKRSKVMVGGNMVSWYGGFDSTIIAHEFGEEINIPSMGRKIDGEEAMGISHLPYMTWVDWIHTLSNYKYGVHLMRTHAAGTFALNCAYLGIPCIGYKGLDTQETLHPYTTVDVGDLKLAREIASGLKYDSEFYNKCSNKTKELYNKKYTEEKFKEKIYESLDALEREGTNN